ncbi:MAG: hypothetical protein WD991_01080 [Candidatus Paceibacterota bacterium]
MHEVVQIKSAITGSGIAYDVHRVLAKSYSMYFLLFLVGVTLDLIFRFRIFETMILLPLGFILLGAATILILWAQYTSRNLDKGNISKETFCRGPYCYTRSPTHWGLFFLMLGFGILANALFVIVTTLISFVISKSVFLKKQEDMLAHKYGMPYLEYKKAVKL